MNINEVRQTILDIETRSQEAHFATFQQASNQKTILKDELERYEELLKDLSAIETLEAFISEHQSVVDEYLKLKDRVDAIKIPAAPVVETEKKIEGSPVIIGEPTKKDETPEIIIPQVGVSDKQEVKVTESISSKKTEEKKAENPGTALAVVEEQKKAKEMIDAALAAPVTNPIVEEKKTEDKNAEQIIVEPGVYGLKRNEIIQDLPINDLSEQIFKTPGMSEEAIKESQDKINAIPIADPKKYVDPIEEEIKKRQQEWEKSQTKTEAPKVEADPYVYKPMTPEEIEESKRKIGGNVQGMSEEEIIAAQEKIGTSAPRRRFQAEAKKEAPKAPEAKPATSEVRKKPRRRRVNKRRRFNWQNNVITQGFNKAYTSLKGLIFGEDISKRSKDYQTICIKIANYRATYKTRTPDVNSKAITSIAEDVKVSQTTYEEKVRLYKKLAKVAKQYQRLTTKQQKEALKDGVEIVEELQGNSLGR